MAFCSGASPSLPPHGSSQAWGLAAKFLEVISASRSEAEGWAKPASQQDRRMLPEWGDWESDLSVYPTPGAAPPCLRQVSPRSFPGAPTWCESSTPSLWQQAPGVHGSRWTRRTPRSTAGAWALVCWPSEVSVWPQGPCAFPFPPGPGTAGAHTGPHPWA